MKQFLYNTVMDRSSEHIKTRKQGVEYCTQNATFLFKGGCDYIYVSAEQLFQKKSYQNLK